MSKSKTIGYRIVSKQPRSTIHDHAYPPINREFNDNLTRRSLSDYLSSLSSKDVKLTELNDESIQIGDQHREGVMIESLNDLSHQVKQSTGLGYREFTYAILGTGNTLVLDKDGRRAAIVPPITGRVKNRLDKEGLLSATRIRDHQVTLTGWIAIAADGTVFEAEDRHNLFKTIEEQGYGLEVGGYDKRLRSVEDRSTGTILTYGTEGGLSKRK